MPILFSRALTRSSFGLLPLWKMAAAHVEIEVGSKAKAPEPRLISNPNNVEVIIDDGPTTTTAVVEKIASDFTHFKGLTSAEAMALLEQHGRNEIVEKTTPSWLIFLRGLYGPMPIAIWIAVIQR